MRGKADTIFQLFPNRYRNKRQASKPSLLRRGEELLRQIGDQATLPPQAGRAGFATRWRASRGPPRRLKRRGSTGIEPMRIKAQATQQRASKFFPRSNQQPQGMKN